jgi:hypothetical protein
MTNQAQFLAIYERRLRQAVVAEPQAYTYPPEEVPLVARRIVAALAAGIASLSPTIKATAREVGIRRPSLRTIREWLTADHAAPLLATPSDA